MCMEKQEKPSPERKTVTGLRLVVWAGLAALEALAALIYLLLLPADPKNVIFMGYSLPRLGLVAGFLALAGLFAWLGAAAWRNPKVTTHFLQALKREELYRCTVILFLLLPVVDYILALLPAYRFGMLAGYAERLRPLFLWSLLVTLQSLILLLLEGRALYPGRFFAVDKKIIRVAGCILLLMLVVWAWVALSGMGLRPDKLHWNDLGVPLLALQVLAALAGGIMSGWLVDKAAAWVAGSRKNTKAVIFLEITVCLALWGLVAWIWSQTPAERNFFAPGPYPPNEEFYPFSDSVTYDISAQTARIGMLYSGGHHVDKPLYSLLLLIVSSLSGDHFSRQLTGQVIFLAGFPVILYLMGKRLHSRAAGFTVAALAVFKEINAYSLVTLQVSHSKLILSEIPTALLLVLFTYFMIRWLENGGGKAGYAAAAGGVLGLSTLLRHNAWFLLPVVGLAGLLVYRKHWRRLALSGLLFSMVFLLGVTPWAWRTAQTIGTPFYFLGAVQGVVWKQRYQPALEKLTPTPAPINETLPDQGAAAAPPAGDQGVAGFVSAHFFHNLVASAFVLPAHVMFDDLQHVVGGTDSIFSSSSWDGHLELDEGIVLFAGLALAAVGIALSWRRLRWAGLMPLATFLGYHLASALARTSGGRYIVPADWGLYFYYALGLVQVVCWVGVGRFGCPPAQEEVAQPEKDCPINWRMALPAGILVLLVGLALPVSERLFPVRYPVLTDEEILAKFEAAGGIEQMGYSHADLERFLENDQAAFLYGKALYPRFYAMDQGEPDPWSFQRSMEFPRLTFTVIGPRGGGALLPLPTSPVFFPHGTDVFVIGCQGKYLDAIAVLVTGSQPNQEEVYRRSPPAPLQCPLRQPVCDDNRNCR